MATLEFNLSIEKKRITFKKITTSLFGRFGRTVRFSVLDDDVEARRCERAEIASVISG